MKFIITIVLIFSQLIAFAQTKEDFLICFEMITEHDDFQPAFENRGITGEDLILVVNRNRSVNQNEMERIQQSLTTDDFYDFDRDVKVIQGDDRILQNLGIDIRHTLGYGFSGNKNTLAFFLNTVVENQNLSYDWNFKFVKEEGEWILAGNSSNKRKTR